MIRDSASTKKRTHRSLKADGFEHGKFTDALANRDGHGVAGDQQEREEDDAANGQDQESRCFRIA